MHPDDEHLTSRETVRELTRLAKAIEKLAAEIKHEFTLLRSETVRSDVYQADRKTDAVEVNALLRRVDVLESKSKSLTTAVSGMLVTVFGGVILFLILGGLNIG